jgi:molybdopterin converting factor small subunit
MPRAHVLYFAALREQKGCPEEWVEVPGHCTVAGLYATLFPDVANRLPVAMIVNRVRTAADHPVRDGDEIAFLPPLGGG